MTSDEYATLMDFLATRFARMDARFDALETRMDRIETRMDRIEARMDSLETRMDRIEARMDSLETRMDRIEARQDAMEARLTRSEVLWESMHDDIRRVAEGVMAVNERLDRFETEVWKRFESVEGRIDGLQVHFDRFAVDFGTVQLDHGQRIVALERARNRPPRG